MQPPTDFGPVDWEPINWTMPAVGLVERAEDIARLCGAPAVTALHLHLALAADQPPRATTPPQILRMLNTLGAHP